MTSSPSTRESTPNDGKPFFEFLPVGQLDRRLVVAEIMNRAGLRARPNTLELP